MRCRTESIHLRRGHQTLSIDYEVSGGALCYVGSIDGRRCVSSASREGALSALLRRMAFGARHSEFAA